MMAARMVRWPKIFLYGDSLTQFSFSTEGCWGAVLADHFFRRADIVKRGFSGYTSRNCLALLPYVATDLKDVVGATVFLGANDASVEGSSQAVPLEEYVSNMKKIVKHFQDAGVKPIVISPPAFDAEAWGEYCEKTGRLKTKQEAMTAMYAEACVNMAKQVGVPYVDLHTAMINQADWRTLLSDGLHLSQDGSRLLASLLIPTLEKHLSAVLPKEPLFPLWDDLSVDNPAASFEQWFKDHQ